MDRFEIRHMNRTFGAGTKYGEWTVSGWYVWDTDEETNVFSVLYGTEAEAREWLPVAESAEKLRLLRIERKLRSRTR